MNGEELSRLAFLTPDGFGRWKIDYESFARIVKPSWSDLLEKKADQGLVRVFVAKDSYYNGPFKDESEWICYGMASPDTSVVPMGYCRKNSPQAKALERIVADSEGGLDRHGLNRATLEIRRPEGAEDRQFEITRVLAEDWVLSPKPFDGNFK